MTSPARVPLPSTLADAPTHETEGYLGVLNLEAIEGARAAAKLIDAGIGGRDALLRENPSWLRVGTLRALLRHARVALDSDASFALELTTFVIAQLDRLTPPTPETAFLVHQLRGLAWKEHGNALFMLGEERLDDALDAAKRADELLSVDPFHVVYRASARVLIALISHYQHRNSDAIPMLDEAIDVFAAHGDAQGYLNATQVHAIIALDERRYRDAYNLYTTVLTEAKRLGDEREQARTRHNIGLCLMRLGQLDEARDFMTEAFFEFSRLEMHGEMWRAIWVTAAIERQRGALEDALGALHAVYARFLERGMATEAARVQLQIGEVVTDLTKDVAYAKEMCAKLVVTMGRYDVPGNVRAALEAVRDASAAARSVTALCGLLHRAAAFLRDFKDSPSAVFNPALTD